jgi:Ubiquitin family
MQIFIETITGQNFAINNVESTDIIFKIRAKLSQRVGGNLMYSQRLIFGCKQLEDEKTLSDYNITEHSTINILNRLRGC